MSVDGPDLSTLLSPRGVAVVGSLSKPDRMGSRTVRHLREAGYAGEIYECSKVADLDDAVDVAVVAVPASAVSEVLFDLEGKARNAIVYSSGFSEAGNVALEVPDRMNLLGPNTVGAYWAPSKAVLSFAQVFDHLTDCAVGPGVAVVSQSGAFGARILRAARNRGLVIDGFIATGNEDGLTTVDALAGLCALEQRPRVVGLYLENVSDGPGLTEALRIARDAGVQVVVLNGGRTPVAAAAAASHTAAVSADHDVLAELLRMEGAVSVDGDRKLVDALIACSLARRLPRRGVAVVTGSGGAGVVAADMLAATDAEVPPVSDQLDERLATLLPTYASWTNPVDVTASVIGDADAVAGVIDALVESDEFGVVLAVGRAEQAELFQRRASQKTAVVTALLDGSDQVIGSLVSEGILAVGDLEAGVRVASVLTEDEMPSSERFRSTDSEPGSVPSSCDLGGDSDTVVSSLTAVGRCGVTTAPWLQARDVDGAVAALEELRAPVVVKANLAAEAHKAVSGGIRLDVIDRDSMRQAAASMLEVSGSVVIAEQIRGGPELFVGIRRDSIAGRVISIGLGGGAVEIIGRTVSVPSRASTEWIADRVHRAVFRGESRWRRTAEALAATTDRLLALAEATDADLVEINPFVETDQGLVALDARVLRRGQR